MRIISYLNVSNGSDLERDSGFLFQRALLEQLSADHDVVLVAPVGAAALVDRVSTIELDWPDTKYGVRFGWPWIGLAAALQDRPRPDVILNNQSEVTTALRMLAYEVYGTPVPVVTYFHYLAVLERSGATAFDPSLDDLASGELIWSRQLEAARTSAASIIGTEYGAAFLREGLGRSGADRPIDVIPPPIIPGLWPGDDGGRTILYNHRLYDHYGTASTMAALERVCARTGAEVVVTDPTQGRSLRRTRLDGGPSAIVGKLRTAPWARIVDAGSWSRYAEVVASSTVGMAPDRPGALWSMSAMDLMSIGRAVLAPAQSGLGKELGADLCFADPAQLEEKMTRLIEDPVARRAAGERCRSFAEQFSVTAIAARFELVFERVASGRSSREGPGVACS